MSETMASAVTRHSSPELGRAEHVERGPHRLLDGVVHRYCGYWHEQSGAARRREAAQDQVTIILGFGTPLQVSGPNLRASSLDCFVAPLHQSYAITEEDSALAGMQIDLSPLGARLLFGTPMHELSAHLVLPLEDVLGREASLLVERLVAQPTWGGRFALLDRWIHARVQAAGAPAPDSIWAWRRLRETAGALPISDLAAELGCSHRHLNSRFRDQVGVTPKVAARLIRFQRTLRQLGDDDGSRFAEIAQGCGYYDQAHMNREFRELAGTTPSAFLASRLPDGLGVAAD